MKNLQIDKNLDKKVLRRPRISNPGIKPVNGIDGIKNLLYSENSEEISAWNFLYVLIFSFFLFTVLFLSLAKLQIVQGEQMSQRSQENSIRITSIPAYRGVIFDRNGEKVVENVPAVNVYLNIDVYLDKEMQIEQEKLRNATMVLEQILRDKWKPTSEDTQAYNSIYEKVVSIYSTDPYFSNILIAKDIDNDTSISIKSMGEELEGVEIHDESKRNYTYPIQFSHILGYVGQASATDIEKYDYVSSNDTVGKLGIEKYYDEILAGENGKQATEINALGHSITGSSYAITPQISGESIYMSIDLKVQNKMYEMIEDAVNQNGAKGASIIIEDVNNGEILSMVSYPGYDSNQFIGGISQIEYDSILNDSRIPLLNRSIGAQVPPGSTFKTLVAASALDAGAISTSTIYNSRRGYTFSSGAPFQEFQNHAYGNLNVIQAIARSSNIYFCETIRHWKMEELAKYLEGFGIGQYTGIDIPGEMPGRLPSAENKIYLAEHGATWLDPIWYPEGDGCNSVMGQGISLVTPIQMVNWVASIANGGILHTPHIIEKTVDEDGNEKQIEYEALRENFIGKKSLEIVRKGMWSVVYSDLGSAKMLRDLGEQVAIKTGTAEFGALNKKGEYEHSHAWITGFYPYEDPKYSFVIFFEDGGLSFESLPYAKDILSWLINSGYK